MHVVLKGLPNKLGELFCLSLFATLHVINKKGEEKPSLCVPKPFNEHAVVEHS